MPTETEAPALPAVSSGAERSADRDTRSDLPALQTSDTIYWDLTSAVEPAAGWYESWKSALDFPVALVLFLLLAPVIAVCALLVRLTSRGPAFYSQVRLGRGGRPFRIYKLRTMTQDAEKGGARWATPGDPRVTWLGRFLRRTHLDELPQLWNVLRGDMSLVGPRPERPEFVPNLERAIPGYRNRLQVKPGVTGLAQVQLPADTDIASVRRKLAYDLHYIASIGFWLDLRLIACTAFRMLGVPYRLGARLFLLPGPEADKAATAQPVPSLESAS
jgi:lipopolysaccharide/colanic/teichoic acid biosynthesis glycosyltransferase